MVPEQKIQLIEILWEIILADNEVHDFETNLIRRLAGLLYISDVECGNAKIRAKPRWIALAGRPFITPKSKMNGKGDAYQSWKKDHNIAIEATIFRWKPFKLLVGEISSWIFFWIKFLLFSDIIR